MTAADLKYLVVRNGAPVCPTARIVFAPNSDRCNRENTPAISGTALEHYIRSAATMA